MSGKELGDFLARPHAKLLFASPGSALLWLLELIIPANSALHWAENAYLVCCQFHNTPPSASWNWVGISIKMKCEISEAVPATVELSIARQLSGEGERSSPWSSKHIRGNEVTKFGSKASSNECNLYPRIVPHFCFNKKEFQKLVV